MRSLGAEALFGVTLAPELTQSWLCPRLIWGGLWGLLYFLSVRVPRARRYWARKGMWISLLPTAIQLFYVYPYQSPFGLLGLGLGALTPLFVTLLNLIWGFFTGLFARALWGRG